MKLGETRAEHASGYRPREYWTDVAQSGASADATGFAPVLHPDAPAWFNRLIDDLQYRAVRRALVLADVPAGSCILDVGCGTGRWIRRYQRMGLRPTGVDATPSMLRLALERGTSTPVAAGEAQRLPFPAGQFDCVSDITVVQHIPTQLQSQALDEMVRVLKRGGRLILMELIRGQAPHIFPRTARGWIEQITLRGPKLLGWFGQEYLLLDRLFVRAAQMIAPGNGSGAPSDGGSQAPVSRRSPIARRAYWAVRHLTAPFSGWIDPAVERACPGSVATHGVFVFQK